MNQNQKILLVDDESNVLQGMTRLLRHQPYVVLTARSAEEAMEILKAHSVDLIVTDEKMSGINGSELTAWVAKYFPDIVRIILTGLPDIPAMINAINNGKVFRYLTKPCNDTQFAMAINEGLELRRKRLSQPPSSEASL